jgi:hypothetical protein
MAIVGRVSASSAAPEVVRVATVREGASLWELHLTGRTAAGPVRVTVAWDHPAGRQEQSIEVAPPEILTPRVEELAFEPQGGGAGGAARAVVLESATPPFAPRAATLARSTRYLARLRSDRFELREVVAYLTVGNDEHQLGHATAHGFETPPGHIGPTRGRISLTLRDRVTGREEAVSVAYTIPA